MGNSNSSSSSSGIGAFGLLGVAFVVLKLIGQIDWSWAWVLLPFWGGVAAFLVFICGVLLFAAYDIYRAKVKKLAKEKGK